MTLPFYPLLALLFDGPLPALATAAAAAAVPIAIHLLTRTRFRTVSWAAMRFLVAAQRRRHRRVRLENALLLAVRVALVVLIVGAMASVSPWADRLWQRILPGKIALVGPVARRTHHILVIDGSLSMGLRSDDATCFDRAKAAAARLIREAPAGDGFGVVLMAVPPRRVVPGPSEDGLKVAVEVEGLRLPHGHADLAGTLAAVEDMLRPENSPSRFVDREVWLFTDMQRTTWTARQDADPRPALEKVRARARMVFVDVGQDGVNNLAVTGLTVGATPATSTQPVSLTATVHNFGTEPRRRVVISWWLGKARASAGEPPMEMRLAAQQATDVAAGQTSAVGFTHRFAAPGDYAVQVRLEPDALDLDDVRTVVVPVRDGVPVLVVNGKPDADPYREAAGWLRDALAPFPAGAEPGEAPARPRVISDADFHDAGLGDLTPYDCVFLCDVRWLTTAEVQRLEAHLQRGGGVVLCLGPSVDLEAYNRLVCRDGEGLLPARLLGYRDAPAGRPFTLRVDADAADLPPLQAFTGNDRAALMAARFRRYVRVELPARSGARRILSFTGTSGGGDPALVEWTRHRGRVLLLTSTANLDWTSWPLSPSYLPLVQELFREALTGRLQSQAAAVGDVLEEPLPLGDTGADAVFHTPDGRTETIHSQSRDDGAVLRWADTDVHGLYRATLARRPREHLFAVNVPTATGPDQASESDPARASPEELRSTYPGWEFQVVTDPADVRQPAVSRETIAVAIGGAGELVARGALWTALALLLAEGILAWRRGRLGAGTDAPARGRLGAALASGLALAVLVGLGGLLGHAAWTGDFAGFLPESWRASAETVLGVPPPTAGEGSRWRLEFQSYLGGGAAAPWLTGLVAVVAAGVILAVYRRLAGIAGTAWVLALAGLRLGSLLVLLAVLLPQVRLWFERQGWPEVAVLIDDSRSMSTADHYQEYADRDASRQLASDSLTPPRLALAQALVAGVRDGPGWLDALVASHRKVRLYRCAEGVERLAGGDVTGPSRLQAARRAVRGLHADGSASRLGSAVEAVLADNRGSSLAAIVMLTDGVTTEGDDLAIAARHAARAGVPLFFAGLGDAEEAPDLRLQDLQVEDEVTVNDRLVFEAQLAGPGYAGQEVSVTLREKGKDAVLATQAVRPDPSGRPARVRLTHRPREAGERTYVLETPVRPEEARADNNRLERTVLVRENRLVKVLIAEGPCRWEFQKVKALLEREAAQDPLNKSTDLHALLLGADPGWARQDRSAAVEFPARAELDTFDVIILGDVDPHNPRIEGHLKDVADFIRERGGGLLLIAGPEFNPRAYAATPLRDVLPVESDASTAAPTEGAYRLELTPAGRSHPLFRFRPDEAENAAVWAALPEFTWCASDYHARWGAEVLAVHPTWAASGGVTGGRHPLAVQQFVGAGRSIFFGFDETWRWSAGNSAERFSQFWVRTIRHLARTRPGRVTLRPDRQDPYRRGEPISLTLRFPADAPRPGPDVPVRVRLVRTLPRPVGPPETEEETMTLARRDGTLATYEGLVTRTPEGDYRFELASPAVEGGLPRATCRVVAPPGELDRLRMNRAEMERAAEETHGRFYTVADAQRLPDDLPEETHAVVRTPQPPRPLWNHPAVLGLTLGLLGAEWLLRKRRHLL